MSEAVTVASRHLLVIDPLADCVHQLPRLQAAGWQVRCGSLDDARRSSADVVLYCISDEHLAQPAAVQQVMRASAASWVVLSADEEHDTTWLDAWACELLALPVDVQSLADALLQAHGCSQRAALQQGRKPRQPLGNSSHARELRRQLDALVPLETPVLIGGEPGTGKQMLAHLLHERSARHGLDLVYLDCRLLSAVEARNQLFGEHAGVGGLVVDEGVGSLVLGHVAELAWPVQARLCEWLEQGTGPRILAIDEGDMEAAPSRKHLHPGLYQALSGGCLQTTPLRAHRGDLLLLADQAARLYGATPGRGQRCFSEDAVEAMARHDWPGNVRELRTRILRALVRAHGRVIRPHDLGLSAVLADGAEGGTLADYILQAERQALDDVLLRYSSNMTQAARSLGISRPTFYRLLHKHQLR